MQTTFPSFFISNLKSVLSFPTRLYAHRGHGSCPEASGRSPRSPAGLREQPAPRGPATGRQAAHDPASAAADGHQGCTALLQHQGAGKGAHAQTLPGDAGGQGLIRGWLLVQQQRRTKKVTWTNAEGTQERETPTDCARQDRLTSPTPPPGTPGHYIKKEQMQNLVISINIKMMQINLKYIRNIMYSNNFLVLLIVSGHVVNEEGPSPPQHLQNK